MSPGPTTTALQGADLEQLELVLSGALGTLDRFPGGREAARARAEGLLDDGAPAPVVPVLGAPDGVTVGTRLRLDDPEGAPVAHLTVAELWDDDGVLRMAGPVSRAAPASHGPFAALRSDAADVIAQFGRGSVVAPISEPLQYSQSETLAAHARSRGTGVLLLALVGTGRGGVTALVDPDTVVRSALAVVRDLVAGDVPARVVVVPLPALPGAAAEARARVLVATSYGAGLVALPAGLPLAVGQDPEVVALPVDVPAVQVAAALDEGSPLPAGLYLDEVTDQLRRARPPRDRRGLVLLFSGLSGSGKSTVAREVYDRLLEQGHRTLTLLDGDVVRRLLSSGLGFGAADRDLNVRRIGFVAAESARHGGVAIAAPIAPYARSRAAVREMVEAAGGLYVLVHVATPLEVCEARDRKGLYARARAGEIPEFTGISDPYEEPADADLRLDTSEITVSEAADAVLALLRARGLLR